MSVRGSSAHRVYSVVVFVILASLDNVAIGIVPPLYGSIGTDFGVGEGHIALATALMFLISAFAAVGWAYAGDRTNRKPVLMLGHIDVVNARPSLRAKIIASSATRLAVAPAARAVEPARKARYSSVPR